MATTRENDEKKKRLWTTFDEIGILVGSLDFIEKNEINIKRFYEQRKVSLQLNFSYNQVRHKLRKLRDKFHSNVKKLNTGVKPKFVFLEAGQELLFYLSEKIWGDPSKKTVEHTYRVLFGNDDAVNEAMPFVDKSKQEDLETKWKSLNDEEMKMFLRRIELVKETVEICKPFTSA